MSAPSVAGLSFCLFLALGRAVWAQVVFETTSPYHHIQVIDQSGFRTLSFDGSLETRMSLRDPLQGHFEYTEYFHTIWLWNFNITNVLMIGLGGGSTQRSFQHYYPQVTVETAELDPAVLKAAQNYFFFKESPSQKVHIGDGRVFLRRTTNKYDAIILDAYVQNRYGSFIPHHLVTKEFFELARDRLSSQGVVAYNVMGSLRGWRADLLAAVYKTIQHVFPQIYLFPASDTLNVVILATRAPQRLTFDGLNQRASLLIQQRRITLPTFRSRLYSHRGEPPLNLQAAPVLTDDYAPVEGLLGGGK